jgi:hypothetical protein
VTVVPAPTVTLSANPTSVTSGGSSTLTWNSTNATTCTASGGWSGARATSGSQSTGALTATTGYTLTCNGTGGSAAQSTTVTVTSTPPPPGPYVYPVKLGPTGRYLVDQNDVPFLLVGDAAWSIIAQLSLAEANTYLANRRQHGFNTILVSLIEHAFADNPPANYAGVLPFTGRPFATPNEAYFAHADAILQAAEQAGIVVLLAPAYLGVDCQSEGWCAEVQQATNAEMRAWGEFVGNRYKDYDNIIWVVGGDTDPTPVAGKLTQMVAGIQAFDTRHLFTPHNDPERMGIDRWPGPPAWLTVNNTYTYSATPYVLARTAYRVAPAMPFFFMEDYYENSGGVTQPQLRAQSYWTLLSGAFGHVFGNCPIWHFDAPNVRYCTTLGWQNQLNNQGSLNMRYFQRLFLARHWSTLVPDDSHVAITAGFGTFGQTNYVTAAYATDGSSIIAYLPSSRAVTVSGSRLAGATMTVYWYNPGTGASTSVGTFATTGTQTFTPPAAGDWVLVVDSPQFGFPPP